MNADQIRLSPLRITVIYLIVASLWIAFTDRLLESWISDPMLLSRFQTLKGGIYVILTGLGLYWLIKTNMEQLSEKEEEARTFAHKFQSERELLEKLFARLPVMVTMYRPGFDEFRINRKFEEVTGWTNEDARRRNLVKACYPDPEVREEAIEFMNNPDTGWKEFPVKTKSGDTLQTTWTDMSLSDDTQVGIGIDLSDIKATEARLRESQKLLRKLFESLNESVIILDPDTREITDCNVTTEEMFGYGREELIGESIRILHVDDNHYEKFGEVTASELDNKGFYHTKFFMKRENGDIFPSDHTVTYIYDDQNHIDKVVSVVRDITDKKKAEEKKLSSVIEGVDMERKRIAKELHDGLGQYLSAAHMYLESVQSHTGKLPEKKQTQFAKGLKLLKNSISETRNISHNLMPREIVDYGLVMATESMVENYEEVTDVDFEMQCEVDDELLPYQLQLNLYRIIQESIKNSLQYSECTEISIHLHRENGSLLLSIEDNGIGPDLNKIMEQNGYGLHNIKTRVQAMSGTLEFDSTPGEGLTIDLRIPTDSAKERG